MNRDDYIISSRYRPMDELYKSCDYTYASLMVYPSDSSEIVSETLGLDPTDSSDKGVSFIGATGRTIVPRATYWSLSSYDRLFSKDIRHHLDWLLNILCEREEKIKELQCLPSIKMYIRCTWYAAVHGGGPTLWPEQMAILSRLNLECNFSIFGPDEDEDE